MILAGLIEPATYKQVLGCIIKRPVLLTEIEGQINVDDFGELVYRAIFATIFNMICNGAKILNPELITEELLKVDRFAATFNSKNGGQILIECIDEKITEENFDYYFQRLKKLSLLRELQKNKFDISYFYNENNLLSNAEQAKIEERFSSATLEEILNKIEGNVTSIRSKFTIGTAKGSRATDGIEQILQDLRNSPLMGAPLCGQILSSVVKGARKGCLYLRSAASSVGKTRLAVFDMCQICYPIHWGVDDRGVECFIEERYHGDEMARDPQKVLFITTEMAKAEIQTIILAYLSGISEARILDGTYLENDNEIERIKYALKIMSKYEDYFFLDEISDPNLTNVKATIKKHILMNGVEYIGYDYIFTSPSLVSQFGQARIREDVALLLLTNQLKEIAKEYNVFITTATQLNADGMKWDTRKDESCLRGAKSVADKIDVGYIISRICPEEKTRLQAIGAFDENNPCSIPTHVLDLYKIRRGEYKNVRLWVNINLGNGMRKDLFLTDQEYNLLTPKVAIPFENWKRRK